MKRLQDQASGRPVEVIALEDSGECASGYKRNALMSQANGSYVAFVDDDARVCDDYVDQLLYGIASCADVITFDVVIGGEHTTLHMGQDDRQRGLMCANHLCAWRRDIAEKVAWHPMIGYGDDQLWYKPLQLVGAAKTEWHLDVPLCAIPRRPYCEKARQRTVDLVGGIVEVYTAGQEILVRNGWSETFGSVRLRDRSNVIHELDCRAVNRAGSFRIA